MFCKIFQSCFQFQGSQWTCAFNIFSTGNFTEKFLKLKSKFLVHQKTGCLANKNLLVTIAIMIQRLFFD